MVAGAHALGPANAEEWLEVTVTLRRRAPLPDLTALALQPPRSRVYVTRAELAARHGADPRDVARVEAFAKAHGLTLIQSSAGERTVRLAGSVAKMTTAFQTKLLRYRSPRGDYRGRVGALFVPPELAEVVQGVFGLDDRCQARSHAVFHPLPPATSRTNPSRPWFTPPELGELYGFPNADGAGECIGLLEFGGGYSVADLDVYFHGLGMKTPTLTAVVVNGVMNRPGEDPGSEGEVMLDIEVAGALAPKARLAVYFSQFTEKGWVDALTRAVHDAVNAPTVLSISWGYAEGQLIWTPACVRAVNDVLEEASLLGVTVCVASGDDGAADDQQDGHAHVDFPASSPFVLAVGGTMLKRAGTRIGSEVVWNGGPRATADGAGGGGVSDMFPVPSWQQGKVPVSVNPGHASGRGVPDVSANSDPRTGYFVRSGGQDGVAGGTSAAAPLWAALIARVNQRIGKPVGFLNALLYQSLAAKGVCRDVTAGNNDTTGYIGGYAARKGWDACTGFGSPSGGALARALGVGKLVGGTAHPAAAAPALGVKPVVKAAITTATHKAVNKAVIKRVAKPLKPPTPLKSASPAPKAPPPSARSPLRKGESRQTKSSRARS